MSTSDEALDDLAADYLSDEDDEPCEECGGFGWTHDVDTDDETTCEACQGTGAAEG